MRFFLAFLFFYSCFTLAVINPTADTRTTDTDCISGLMAVGECPNGYEYVPQGLIFSENFDAQPDWTPTIKSLGGILTQDDETPPENWSHFRVAELWHPSSSVGNSTSLQINDSVADVQGDKSMIVYDESWGSNGEWGSDAILTKTLDQSYSEITVKFDVKFQTGFRWMDVENAEVELQSAMKLFRASRWYGDINDDVYNFFGDTARHAPRYIIDLKSWSYDGYGVGWNRARMTNDIKCDTYDFNWACYSGNREFPFPSVQPPEGYYSFAQTFNYGQWNTFEVRLKMNSAPGVADGIVQVTVNGDMITDIQDIQWMNAGSSGGLGWNMVMFGGNMNNYPEPDSEKFEQWYAIDNIEVFSSLPEGY